MSGAEVTAPLATIATPKPSALTRHPLDAAVHWDGRGDHNGAILGVLREDLEFIQVDDGFRHRLVHLPIARQDGRAGCCRHGPSYRGRLACSVDSENSRTLENDVTTLRAGGYVVMPRESRLAAVGRFLVRSSGNLLWTGLRG